jgi:phage terminase Nu1 subunit (DNA packaging protein)
MRKDDNGEKEKLSVQAIRDAVDFRRCPAGVAMDIFGVSRSAFDRWREGPNPCPRNADGTWDTAVVTDWRIGREKERNKRRGRDELEDEKLEKDIELKDLQIKRRKEQVIDMDKHLQILGARIVSLRVWLTTTLHRELYRLVGKSVEEMHPVASEMIKEAVAAYIAGSRSMDSETKQEVENG